jgi:hypothetical protein
MQMGLTSQDASPIFKVFTERLLLTHQLIKSHRFLGNFRF